VAENAIRGVVVVSGGAALLAVGAGLWAMFTIAPAPGVALAIAPVAIVTIGALIASNRAILVVVAFALPLLAPLPVSGTLPIHIGIQVYPSDILVFLAIAAWAAAWLINPADERPSLPRAPLLGWPLLLFGIALFAAIIRGHERYGETLFSLPLRFLLYAGIAFALSDLKPRDAYRWLVAVFYAGTLWQVGVAIRGYATGTSATTQVVLSTGGERVLAGSTAMFMAGALLLALLNLETQRTARETAFHLVMAGLATFALVSTFQRTTFAAASILVPIVLLMFRRVGLRTAAFVPVLVPFLVLAALLVPRADPTLFPTFRDRVTASPSTDASAQWRLKAYSAVWAQVREDPLRGVGFGRPAIFASQGFRYNVGQDPHNQFLYLWAGGGLLLFGTFVLVQAFFLLDAASRFGRATIRERLLIFWTVSLWFVFIINSLTGITLTQPDLLLAFWVLLVLPMTVNTRFHEIAERGNP
jgi:O-antigen ligase